MELRPLGLERLNRNAFGSLLYSAVSRAGGNEKCDEQCNY